MTTRARKKRLKLYCDRRVREYASLLNMSLEKVCDDIGVNRSLPWDDVNRILDFFKTLDRGEFLDMSSLYVSDQKVIDYIKRFKKRENNYND